MSMNDPDWGRKSSDGNKDDNPSSQNDKNRKPGNKQDGPPDLDELWKHFNNQVNLIFGKRRNNGGPSGPAGGGGSGMPNIDGAGKGVGAIAIIGLLIWLASGFFIIQEGREGVVLQFGKYHHTAVPGFQWRLPYPIQSHEVVNSSQVRIIEVGYRNEVKTKILNESLMLTDDENIIDIQFAVQYRLKNAAAYLFNNAEPDEAVKGAAETAIREVVGRNKMDFVLYEGREQIALDTTKVVQEILDKYATGILVTSVTVQNVQPPEQVQAAFDDAVKAGQDRERLKNDGQAYANDVIPRARGNAARLLEEAQGYRERVVAQASGDSERFKSILVEYNKAPKITKERLYLEMMQEVFSNVTKIIADSKGSNNLLYLPLDKLIEQTGVSTQSTQTLNQAMATRQKNDTPNTVEKTRPSAADLDSSLRDALRNRERGAR